MSEKEGLAHLEYFIGLAYLARSVTFYPGIIPGAEIYFVLWLCSPSRGAAGKAVNLGGTASADGGFRGHIDLLQ